MFSTRRKLEKLEYENEVIKNENEQLEESLKEKDEAIREIYRLIRVSKNNKIYGEAGYRDIFRQITELVEKNVKKNLLDEIFPYFTPNR